MTKKEKRIIQEYEKDLFNNYVWHKENLGIAHDITIKNRGVWEAINLLLIKLNVEVIR